MHAGRMQAVTTVVLSTSDIHQKILQSYRTLTRRRLHWITVLQYNITISVLCVLMEYGYSMTG